MSSVLEYPSTELAETDWHALNLAEKKRLYFEAGAEEVWFCEGDGAMRFYHGPEEEAMDRSERVPEFPRSVV